MRKLFQAYLCLSVWMGWYYYLNRVVLMKRLWGVFRRLIRACVKLHTDIKGGTKNAVTDTLWNISIIARNRCHHPFWKVQATSCKRKTFGPPCSDNSLPGPCLVIRIVFPCIESSLLRDNISGLDIAHGQSLLCEGHKIRGKAKHLEITVLPIYTSIIF